MTVLQTSAGWTEISPSNGGREIHVSPSTGSDNNAGSSPASPMRTPSKALSYFRDGHGDHLCLKSGDTFDGGLGKWIWSGESSSNPACVRTYGGLERAHLRTCATEDGIFFQGGGGAPPKVQHVIFSGIDFHSVGRDGTEGCCGVRFLRPVNDVLFEDCRWQGYGNGLVLNGFDGPLNNIRLRRCVVLDSWGSSGHVQGLYADKIAGLHLSECVFDHNGWNPDIFRHGIYCQNGNGPSNIDGCVISQSSSHGLQLRSGGRVKGNLFLRNPIAMTLGGGDAPVPGGVDVDVRANVILEGRDIDSSNPRGWGIHASNIHRGLIANNIIAHNEGKQPSGLRLEGEVASGIKGLLVDDNIVHNWGAELHGSGDLSMVKYKGNRWDDSHARYFNPTRGIPSYMESIGWSPSTDSYIKAAREQSKANWNRKLMPMNGLLRHVVDGFRAVA